MKGNHNHGVRALTVTCLLNGGVGVASGAPPQEGPDAAHLGSDASQDTSVGDLTAELINQVDRLGAVYLSVNHGCEEWEATSDLEQISLTRHWYPLNDPAVRQRHFWLTRSITINSLGLVLDDYLELTKEIEILDQAPRRFRVFKYRGRREPPKPRLRRVERNLHYSIGGAEVYFSRRVCEGARLAARQKKGTGRPLQPSRSSVLKERMGATQPADRREEGEDPSIRQLTSEVVRQVDKLGALYLSIDHDRCAEWAATSGSHRLSLISNWYRPDDPPGNQRRSWNERTISIHPLGMRLEAGPTGWEETDPPDQEVGGLLGSAESYYLCDPPEPKLRRVRRDLHYVIGDTDVFFSRRACEDARTRPARKELLAVRCGTEH